MLWGILTLALSMLWFVPVGCVKYWRDHQAQQGLKHPKYPFETIFKEKCLGTATKRCFCNDSGFCTQIFQHIQYVFHTWNVSIEINIRFYPCYHNPQYLTINTQMQTLMQRYCQNVCESCFKFPVHRRRVIVKADSCWEISRKDTDEIDSTAGLLKQQRAFFNYL